MNKWVFNIHTQLSSWEYDFFLIEKVSFSIRGASESNKTLSWKRRSNLRQVADEQV